MFQYINNEISERETKKTIPLTKASRSIKYTMENIMGAPKKIKNQIPCDPPIPFPDIHPKKTVSLSPKHIGTFIFIAALFTIANLWKQTKYPSLHEQIK